MNWMTILFAAGPIAMARGSQTKLLKSKKKTNEQVIREGSFELDLSAGKALPFFTPEGERAWVNGWDPDPNLPRANCCSFQGEFSFPPRSRRRALLVDHS